MIRGVIAARTSRSMQICQLVKHQEVCVRLCHPQRSAFSTSDGVKIELNSAGAKHDFRKVTLGVSLAGPTKSLIFLF